MFAIHLIATILRPSLDVRKVPKEDIQDIKPMPCCRAVTENLNAWCPL
jgi:hypothetical protein